MLPLGTCHYISHFAVVLSCRSMSITSLYSNLALTARQKITLPDRVWNQLGLDNYESKFHRGFYTADPFHLSARRVFLVLEAASSRLRSDVGAAADRWNRLQHNPWVTADGHGQLCRQGANLVCLVVVCLDSYMLGDTLATSNDQVPRWCYKKMAFVYGGICRIELFCKTYETSDYLK